MAIDHTEITTAACESRSKAQRLRDEEERLAFETLYEQKTAEYAQMVLGLQAEKQQRIAEYAARQSELDRSRSTNDGWKLQEPEGIEEHL